MTGEGGIAARIDTQYTADMPIPSARSNLSETQKTILLVEDQAFIAMSETRSLQTEGYLVRHAFTGERAIELMDEDAGIDLVLMDIDLGKGIDGTEAARRILEDHDVPVVFLSAHTESDIVARTEGITNYGYIVKNLGTTVLFAAIKMAFKLHLAHRRLEDSEAHYRSLFDATSTAVLEEDFSAAKDYFNALRARGIVDLRAHFASDPEALKKCAALVRIVDFNQEYMSLVGAKTRGEVAATLAPYVSASAAQRIGEEFFALDEGRTPIEIEFRNEFASIPDQHLKVKLSLVAGHEEDWSRVLVSLADVTQEKRAQESLSESLREKDALMRELSHRVKNNLSIVSSLLNLEAQRGISEEARSPLLEAQSRIQSISNIYDLLSRSKDIEGLDAASYIENLVGIILDIHHVDEERIAIGFELDSFYIDAKRAVSIGLIVNELVTNALKYAFPGEKSGRIGISLHAREEGIVLEVADNGVGLPPLFDRARSDSLGLQLVEMLSSQLGGSLSIASEAGVKARVLVPGT